jgi:stage II sporulation protein AA (anti-sigma F factor antagonist)
MDMPSNPRSRIGKFVTMEETADREGQFTVATSTNGARHELSLSGELDIATAGQLTAALDESAPTAGQELVIDLTSVGFMDSTGLRVLIEANNRAKAGSFELIVVTGDSPARRVLELTRMDEHMRVVSTL